MIEIAGLWKHKSKSGDSYLAGNLGRKGRLLALRNQFKKEGSAEPDFRLMVVESNRDDNAEPPQASPDPGAAPHSDDIPF